MKSQHFFSFVLGLFLALPIFLFAQDDQAQAIPETFFSADGVRIEMGSWYAENLWMRDAKTAGVRQSQTWRFFMHGIRDHRAMPIAWPQLFESDKEAVTWLDESQTLQNEQKRSNFPVLKLENDQILVFPKPVLDLQQLAALRGRKLRFFVWIKAEGCAEEAQLWDAAPTLHLSLKDVLDNLIVSESSLFKTRGSFPWFCYYMEIDIPVLLNTTPPKVEDGEAGLDSDLTAIDLLASVLDPSLLALPELPKGGGLYLAISMLGSGKAWFSTLSWEIATRNNTPNLVDICDPVSGSRAPNPDHDELPMHFFFGLEPSVQWDFLLGNKTCPALNSLNGLRQYVAKASKDWFHIQYGLAMLGYAQSTGTILKQCPEFENGWRESLLQQLLLLQNPQNGLWGNGDGQSLMLTAAVAGHAFNPSTLQRTDMEQVPTPWLSLNKDGIPHKSALLQSLLRSRLLDPDSGKPKAWNRFAFQSEQLGRELRDKVCDLGASAAATRLLAMIASQSNIISEQEAARQAIRQSWEYCAANFVNTDYLWTQTDLSQTVTTPAHMFALLEASAWLEPKKMPAEAEIHFLADNLGGGDLRLRWIDRKGPYAALRIYALPDDLEPEQMNESHILGILNRNQRSLLTSDPLFGLHAMATAAHKHWGISLESEGATYMAKKLAALPKELIFADGGAEAELNFKMPQSSETSFRLYLRGVSAYSELSQPQRIFE
ncbi:MAG: hypothetical protein GX946_05445 [Oligosphaeraceae bacterium]|nr:hypothetical protein [Oligosphaeraceae bacterium]